MNSEQFKSLLAKQTELYLSSRPGGNVAPFFGVLFLIVAFVALLTSGGLSLTSLPWLPTFFSGLTFLLLVSVPVQRIVKDSDAPWVTRNDLVLIFFFVLFGLRSQLVTNPIAGAVVWMILLVQPVGLLAGLFVKYPAHQFNVQHKRGLLIFLAYLALNVCSDVWTYLNVPFELTGFKFSRAPLSFPVDITRAGVGDRASTYRGTASGTFRFMTNTTGPYACVTSVKFPTSAGSINFDDTDCCGYLVQSFAGITTALSFSSPYAEGICHQFQPDDTQNNWKVTPRFEAPFFLKLWGPLATASRWSQSED